MKLSEYMVLLLAIHDEHGDLEVNTKTWQGFRMVAPKPTVEHKAILRNRESRDKFYSKGEYEPGAIKQGEARKGEKVVRV